MSGVGICGLKGRWLVVGVLMALAVGQPVLAENLVRNPGFEQADAEGKPEAWRTGEESRLDREVRHSGEVSLFVSGSAMQHPVAVKPETGYRLSVWARRDESGLTRLMSTDSAGIPIAATDNGGYGMPAWTGAFDWTRFEVAFRTGAHTRISIYLIPLGGRKTAWFDEVQLVEDDDVQVGDVSPLDPPLPPLTAQEQERGYVCFTRNPLERVYHTAIPTREEITERLVLRAAPGQYEPLLLAVHALRPLSHLRVRPSALTGPGGAVIPRANIEARVTRPSRRNISSVSFEALPLFLPLARTSDLAAGATRVFWLTVHVPEATAPGIYRGEVRVQAGDAPEQRVAMEVRVRPVRLLAPPIAFGMYYHLGRMPEQYRSREYQELYYRDMRAHGMTSVTTYNYPNIVTDEAGNQRLAFEQPRGDYLSLDDEMALVREVGPSAPGIPLLYLGSFAGGPGGRTWTEALRRHQQERGWPELLIYVTDEPSTPERIEAAKREMAAYAGLEGIRTVTAGLHVEELGPLYDVWIQGLAVDDKTMQRAAEWGKEVWSYDCSLHGATPRHDRYLAGLHAWAWRKRGVYQWAYTHFRDRYVTPQGQWKGADAWQYGYVIAGPEGPIPTVGWEGRREGVDDYRYLHTLEVLVEQARRGGSRQQRATANRAGGFLDSLRASVEADPWAERQWRNMNEYATAFIPQPEIKLADYDRIRETAAQFIELLQPAP